MNGSFIDKNCSLVKQIIFPNGIYHLYPEGYNINCWIYPKNVFQFNKQDRVFDVELDRQGIVYFLVSDGEFPRDLYIGETTDFKERIGTHIRKDKFNFDFVVTLFRDGRGWSTSVIKYMENKYIEFFRRIHKNKKRYHLQNSIHPAPASNVEDEFVCLKAIEDINKCRLLETAFGDKKLFEKNEFFTTSIDIENLEETHIISTQQEINKPNMVVNIEELFVTDTAGIVARAIRKPNGIEVQKGSYCKKEWSDQNIKKYPFIFNLREDLINNGTLKITKDCKFYEFTTDYQFSSFDIATKMIKGVFASEKLHWRVDIDSDILHINRKKGIEINAFVKKCDKKDTFLILKGSEAKVKTSEKFQKTDFCIKRENLFEKLLLDGVVEKNKDENKYVFVKPYVIKTNSTLLQTITGGNSSNISYYAKPIKKENVPIHITVP